MFQNITIIEAVFLLTLCSSDLRGMGVETVIRYYEIQDSQSFPNKLPTREEAQEWSEVASMKPALSTLHGRKFNCDLVRVLFSMFPKSVAHGVPAFVLQT